MSEVFNFKSIARKLNCNEQKADFEEKNPKPEPNKVVWSPEWGYGVPVVPFESVTAWPVSFCLDADGPIFLFSPGEIDVQPA